MSPLYCSDLNACVDHIIENQPSHADMINALESHYGKPKKDLRDKYIVRHKKNTDHKHPAKQLIQLKTKISKRIRKNNSQQKMLESAYI